MTGRNNEGRPPKEPATTRQEIPSTSDHNAGSPNVTTPPAPVLTVADLPELAEWVFATTPAEQWDWAGTQPVTPTLRAAAAAWATTKASALTSDPCPATRTATQQLLDDRDHQERKEVARVVAERQRRSTTRDISEESDESPEGWPEPPGPPAYSGLAGRVVALALPHTEADPVAILAQFLAVFGNIVGQRPHAIVGATRHGTNLFAALVGATAKARKGDSWSPVREIVRRVEPDYLHDRVLGGFGSGEAVIHAVRDPLGDDPGEPDKRLAVLEPELARILRVAGRQGSILSEVMRLAWDRDVLRNIVKGNPATATGAHVSVVAHVTTAELRREMTDTAVFSGWANRFLWLAVRRSKELPEPDPFDGRTVDALADELDACIRWAAERDRIDRDPEARALWRAMYHDLSADHPGLAGAAVARGEPQVLRLSMVYALLDRSPVVQVDHLRAAVELWAYAERSAFHIFGDATGDPDADRVEDLLRRFGPLTREGIVEMTSRHVSGARLDDALRSLARAHRARSSRVPTGGRTAERWEALPLSSLSSLMSQPYLAIARGETSTDAVRRVFGNDIAGPVQ